MNRKGRQALVLAAAACIALLVLGVAAAAGLGPARPQPTAQGITVYGRWTLTVRDHQGHRIAVRHFENALLNAGQVFLTKLLSRNVTIGKWQVILEDKNTGDVISEPGATNAVAATTLTVSTTSTLASGDPNVLVLQGSFTPPAARTYDGVFTQNNICSAQDAAGSCTPTAFVQYLTRATLSPPVDVAAGDTIGVHVEISFGAAPEGTTTTSSPTTTTQTQPAQTTTRTTTTKTPTLTKPKTGISSCTHSDGFGGSYTDCADPLGTYTGTTAMDAAAEVAPGKVRHDYDCSGNGSIGGHIVIVANNGTEYFWIYSGPLAGKAGSVATSAAVMIRNGVDQSAHMDPLGPGNATPGGCGVANLFPLMPGIASKSWT